VLRRTLLIALTSAAVSAPSLAATAPPTRTPEQAVAAVQRILQRTMKPCRDDWARIDAHGYTAHWTVRVRVRSSRAGSGNARWAIGKGWPVARNALASALAHGCRSA
jgi:hypothetical protein